MLKTVLSQKYSINIEAQRKFPAIKCNTKFNFLSPTLNKNSPIITLTTYTAFTE